MWTGTDRSEVLLGPRLRPWGVAYVPAPFPVFTAHELTVIDGTIEGREVTDIAASIGRSPAVVVQHLKNIGEKFVLASKVHQVSNDPPAHS